MNKPFSPQVIDVRILDREDQNELARIDNFVGDHADGTAFHRPAWILGVSKACGHDWRYMLAENADSLRPFWSGIGFIWFCCRRRNIELKRPGDPNAGRCGMELRRSA